MYHISRRVGKTWDSLTQYIRRIEQLAAIRNTRIEAQQADYKTQELPTKTQELPTKTQELPTKTQELETKTQELPEYTPPEGWRVLAVGEILQAGDMWVWPTDDQLRQTLHAGAVVGANQRYIRQIEPQPQPESEPDAATIEELRSEVSYVQRLLGESNLAFINTLRKVTQLEDLVGSLRAINEAQEKAFEAAGKENTDLQHRLNVVATEWAEQAETIRRLQIELDAAQQVPADSAPMANNDVISRSDAVDAVVLAAVEHVVAIVARLHNTQVTPELHNTIVQAIGQLTAQSPEQHDEAIPPVVAEHCDAMPTLVQSVFYNIPDAG